MSCVASRWVPDAVDVELTSASQTESARLIDAAQADSDRMREECDHYVDSKLAEFEETLNGTLRIVGRGRQQLRTGMGMPDYVSDYRR